MSRDKILTFKFQKLSTANAVLRPRSNVTLQSCSVAGSVHPRSASLTTALGSSGCLEAQCAGPFSPSPVMWAPSTGKELGSDLPVLYPMEEADWLNYEVDVIDISVI